MTVSQVYTAEENDRDATFYNEKGLAYFNEGFYKFTPKARLEEAAEVYELTETEFKKALALNPSFIEAYLNLARLYYVQKDYYQTATAYQEALDLEPENINTAVTLANTFYKMGEHDRARILLIATRDRVTNNGMRDLLSALINNIETDH